MYLALYFFLLEPRWFYFISGVKTIFRYTNILIALILLAVYLFKKVLRSKIIDLIILYHAYLIGITIVNKGELSTAISDSSIFVGLSILTAVVIRTDTKFLFTKLLYLLEAEIFINLMTMVFFPNGFYTTELFTKNYFLGYENQMINIFIPAIFLALNVYIYNRQDKSVLPLMHLIFVSAVVIASIIIAWSGASLVMIATIFAVVLTGAYERTNLFNMFNYLIINIAMFFVIVLLRLQQVFEYLIVTVLHRSLSFTGRIYIWDYVIEYIKRNPIWGYGIEGQEDRFKKVVTEGFVRTTRLTSVSGLHAHNRYLETFYRGGIILTIIYAILLIMVVNILMKYRNVDSAKILSIILFAYLTGMLTEFYRLSYMFFPFMVMADYILFLDRDLSRRIEPL